MPSHFVPSVPSRLPVVAAVSAHRLVPSVALSVCAAAARVLCLRLASGGPIEAPALVPVLPPQAPASLGSHSDFVSPGRPLSLGRAGRIALVRRVSSSARRGPRRASSDFQSTGVACVGGAFVSLRRSAAAAPARALARIAGTPRVLPRGPTHRSTRTPRLQCHFVLRVLRWVAPLVPAVVRGAGYLKR